MFVYMIFGLWVIQYNMKCAQYLTALFIWIISACSKNVTVKINRIICPKHKLTMTHRTFQMEYYLLCITELPTEYYNRNTISLYYSIKLLWIFYVNQNSNQQYYWCLLVE